MEVPAAKHGEKPGEKPAAAAGSELPALLAKADATQRRNRRGNLQGVPHLRKGAAQPDRPQSL